MQKKDDIMGNKTAGKEGKEGKKRVREKDRNIFAKKIKIWLLRMRKKQSYLIKSDK